MSRLSPDTAWRLIVMDTRLPAKSRIIALEQIARPSLNLLRRLLSQKSTPARLRLLAASKYADAIAREEGRSFLSISASVNPKPSLIVGQEVLLKNGQSVTVTKVNQDGTFEYR